MTLGAGRITTPRETDLPGRVRALGEHWAAAGRAGAPHVVAPGVRVDPGRVDHLAAGGVGEVVIGLPDAGAVPASVAKMGARLHR